MLPTLNLPVKSFQSGSKKSRSSATISKRKHFQEQQLELQGMEPDTEAPKCYSCLKDFLTRIRKLKLKQGWHIFDQLDHVEVKLLDEDFMQPKYEIFVKKDLTYTLRCYGWIISPDLSSVIQSFPSFEKITLSSFITALEGYKICQGRCFFIIFINNEKKLCIHFYHFNIYSLFILI